MSKSPKNKPIGAEGAEDKVVWRSFVEPPNVSEVSILWISEFMSCDGDSVSATAAMYPSIEDVVLGNIPGLPKVNLYNKVLSKEVGEDFLEPFYRAAEGKLDHPFVLVIEGSIPNEKVKAEGYWAAMGNDKETGQPILSNTWIDRLAPHAWAVVAAGTCATYGGIHAMHGNPTGSMGLPDYLGWKWKSKAGIPIVCVPGCPIQPDNFMETLLYVLNMAAGRLPLIPLDDNLRPKWLFGNTVHEGCDRGSFYEQGEFAHEYGKKECLVKVGCWGPVVNCNVPKRGWMNNLGGCPNVGGICIACTMPHFPDKYMPFMDEPPGAGLSSNLVTVYGKAIKSLRRISQAHGNMEPSWRHNKAKLTTGYKPGDRYQNPKPEKAAQRAPLKKAG
jgi:hydrogenase small subunit